MWSQAFSKKKGAVVCAALIIYLKILSTHTIVATQQQVGARQLFSHYNSRINIVFRGGRICENTEESHSPLLSLSLSSSLPSRRPSRRFAPHERILNSCLTKRESGSYPSWDPHRFLPSLRRIRQLLFPPLNPSARPPPSTEPAVVGILRRGAIRPGGDGRREGADRGEVPPVRRHGHRAQQVRPRHHRHRAQGVRPRSVAAG